MAYEVGFKPAALRQLRKIDADVQTAILMAIASSVMLLVAKIKHPIN